MSDYNFKTDDALTYIDDYESAKSIVYWGLSLELREWGLKDIYVTIEKVIISYEKDGQEYCLTTPHAEIEHTTDKWPLYPSSVHFKDGKITVEF